ncbi:MAG: OmpA family protein [Luteimonas sp.]
MQVFRNVWMGCVVGLALAACTRSPAPADDVTSAAPATPAPVAADAAEVDVAVSDSTVPDMPVIPAIVVPDIVGVTPAQRALESSMAPILDPVAGISVRPARCDTDGALIDSAGITRIDETGALVRNGDAGIFRLAPDGSGTANFEGGLITVNADGSGTINGTAEPDGSEAIVRVEADGSGTYNGKSGLIRLDGKGGGTWNGDSGLITSNGDGSGSWNGPDGLVRIEADGSGTWNGPHGLITNNGDGTGTIGPPARPVKMPPMPRVAPAGRFPPLQTFAPPGAPCGYVVTLDERVLFDFDKSDIRADAARTLDVFATALQAVEHRGMEVRGHTDAKGDDAYNQSLSERRAAAVRTALQTRGVAGDIGARGFGESQPVAPNTLDGQDNPGGRQLNRRVEVFIRA